MILSPWGHPPNAVPFKGKAKEDPYVYLPGSFLMPPMIPVGRQASLKIPREGPEGLFGEDVEAMAAWRSAEDPDLEAAGISVKQLLKNPVL